MEVELADVETVNSDCPFSRDESKKADGKGGFARSGPEASRRISA